MQEDPLPELLKIAKSYSIEIVTARAFFPIVTGEGKIDGKIPDSNALARYIPLFTAEFGLYPPSLIKKAKLARIVLCQNLAFAGQARAAIPDFEHDTLYLDVSRGDYNKTYQRTVIHHEFFHIIDYQDDGEVYQDEKWKILNTVSFRYGKGGINAQDNRNTSLLTDKYVGFLTHYATTGVEEDKAEVFAHLIVHSRYVKERAQKDIYVRVKVARMKDLLLNFCPDMNGSFWEKIRT